MSLGLSDRGTDDARDDWRPLGRSPGGSSPWISPTTRWILGLLASAVIAYYTTVGTIQTRTAVLEEREQDHFSEVLRRLDQMASDIKAIRHNQ